MKLIQKIFFTTLLCLVANVAMAKCTITYEATNSSDKTVMIESISSKVKGGWFKVQDTSISVPAEDYIIETFTTDYACSVGKQYKFVIVNSRDEEETYYYPSSNLYTHSQGLEIGDVSRFF